MIFEENQFIEKVDYLFENYSLKEGILSSVGVISDENRKYLTSKLSIIELDSNTKVPFKNLYKTPNTLGVDRIALVAAASQKFKNNDVLMIDAGTCITYDFLNAKNEYLGGAISLGIDMRYKALNSYTSNLPRLKQTELNSRIGDSTQDSMHSGIINGVIKEIEGIISEYRMKYSDLTVVLTGGDTNFLAKQLKSSIFANPNFVLEGLNAILIYNRGEC